MDIVGKQDRLACCKQGAKPVVLQFFWPIESSRVVMEGMPSTRQEGETPENKHQRKDRLVLGGSWFEGIQCVVTVKSWW